MTLTTIAALSLTSLLFGASPATSSMDASLSLPAALRIAAAPVTGGDAPAPMDDDTCEAGRVNLDVFVAYKNSQTVFEGKVTAGVAMGRTVTTEVLSDGKARFACLPASTHAVRVLTSDGLLVDSKLVNLAKETTVYFFVAPASND